MKIFDKENKSKAMRGDYSKLMEERKKLLPKVKKSIDDIFNTYDGELVTVIRIMEDENGAPETARIFTGGGASLQSSIMMVEALEDAALEMKKEIVMGYEKLNGTKSIELEEALTNLADELKKIIKDK